MHFLTSLIRVTLLTYIVKRGFAFPLDSTSSEIIEARQEFPRDYGTSQVKATYNGHEITYTQHWGVRLTNDADSNEVIEVAGPLLDTLKKMMEIKELCPSQQAHAFGNASFGNSSNTSPRSMGRHKTSSSYFRKRQGDGRPIFDIEIGPCTESRYRWALGNMRMGAQGGFIEMVPANAAAREVADYQNRAITEARMRIEGFLYEEEDISWTTTFQKRALAGILPAVVAGLENNAFQGNVLKISPNAFLKFPDDTRECGEGEAAPSCADSNCHGVNGRCTADANTDCKCIPLVSPFPAQRQVDEALDAQQQAILDVQLGNMDGIGPQCYGLGTQTWFTQAAGDDFVAKFCDDIPLRKDGRIDKDFGQDTDNFATISVEFKNNFVMVREDCRVLLYRIMHECDAYDDNNPNNLKHGGKIEHPLGATISINPKHKQAVYCNGYQNKKWIDYEDAQGAIKDFCGKINLNGKAGETSRETYNKDQGNEMILSLAYSRDFSIPREKCEELMSFPLDRCDNNDPINNPNNNKYGGHFIADEGIIINITPQKEPPTFPPDAIDKNGNQIVEGCIGGKAGWVDQNTINGLIDEYCKDGDGFGEKTRQQPGTPWYNIYLHIAAKEVDGGSVYKQGPTVCKHRNGWEGKIRANDCKYALGKMRDKCTQGDGFYNSQFIHNCAEWSMWSIVSWGA
ncbi:hypothetical protein BGZ60DRAFT_535456 [Tricladium varicosporioides]|nr:hypothetical protein BGZ60DRAFT_535456 [Hymenoscyphus varicosporioides]